jgi:deazaflavin-dependent oxidoreductase (nitroreductase family)
MNALDNTLAWLSAHIPLFTARTHRLFYRLSAHQFGSRLPGYHILWLTTAGRKTGRLYTWPLIYLRVADELIILASNNGADTHPQWYLNLLHDPAATVEVDGRQLRVCGRTATSEERAQFWPIAISTYPLYGVVAARTTREIPVVVLSPLATAPDSP